MTLRIRSGLLQMELYWQRLRDQGTREMQLDVRMPRVR